MPRKTTSLIIAILVVAGNSCTQPGGDSATTARIDSLQKQLEKYKPGLGEIMMGIQTHHAKLWFAGVNNNWKLAEYETGELKEMADQAKEIETDRPEVKLIPMLYPAIDSISLAVQQKNPVAFKAGFLLLTNTCNSCHTVNHFEFNVITVPSIPPVDNQDFKPR
ncbi:MAG TPA: hypothetical protein VGM41_09500 [Chitinophagaceae bacterium]|jgi:hypothetical protein